MAGLQEQWPNVTRTLAGCRRIAGRMRQEYSQLLKQKKISHDEKIYFVVPTGNFSNLLAGWYAKKMELQIDKLVCASNGNKVLTDFFRSGSYNHNREFRQTSSPSMDIFISCNLERFLFEITGHDTEKINRWMENLSNDGSV